MPDKKLTDNEIKKAFQLATIRAEHPGFVLCGQIIDLIDRQEAEIEQWKEEANKYQNLWCDSCSDLGKANAEVERLKELLAEWKTQAYKVADEKDRLEKYNDELKAINENLKAEIQELKIEINMFRGYDEEIKSEAYKEFAERLKKEVFNTEYHIDRYYRRTLDNLLKEMVGDEK